MRHPIVILLFTISCSQMTIKRSEKDTGSTSEMNIGDNLEIVLKANPTTGYRWEVASIDSTILENTGVDYKPDKVPRDIVGSGGKTIFRFRAAKTGQTDLKLIYHQPFEKNVPPVKTFKLTVVVQ